MPTSRTGEALRLWRQKNGQLGQQQVLTTTQDDVADMETRKVPAVSTPITDPINLKMIPPYYYYNRKEDSILTTIYAVLFKSVEQFKILPSRLYINSERLPELSKEYREAMQRGFFGFVPLADTYVGVCDETQLPALLALAVGSGGIEHDGVIAVFDFL